MLIDEATLFDFGMQMTHRSVDQNGVRQVNDLTETENMIDNLWYECRDNSTVVEKTHEPKFYEELAAVFKETEGIQLDRWDIIVFPMTVQVVDPRADIVSPTLALLEAMATRGNGTRRGTNTEDPRCTYRDMAHGIGRTTGSGRRAIQYTLSDLSVQHLILALPPGTNEKRLGSPTSEIVPTSHGGGHCKSVSEILAYLMSTGLTAMY